LIFSFLRFDGGDSIPQGLKQIFIFILFWTKKQKIESFFFFSQADLFFIPHPQFGRRVGGGLFYPPLACVNHVLIMHNKKRKGQAIIAFVAGGDMHPARIVRRAKILGIIAGQQQQQKKDEITLSLMRPRSWMSLPPCVAGAHTHTTGPVVDGALSFEAAHKICVTRQVIHISTSLLPHNLIPFALHNESG
jgi:hypothetical protein